MVEINSAADNINVISNFKETKMKVFFKVINTNRNHTLKKEFLLSEETDINFLILHMTEK